MALCFVQRIWKTFRTAGLLAGAVLVVNAPGTVFAHEGHAALPSTGATVDGDQVLVSAGARKGLGLKTATITLKDLSRVLRVRARVELPFNGQAMVTTLVPGRMQTILVKPGETVEAGQELARLESLEMETLQLTMLQAAEEVAMAQRLVDQRRPLVSSGALRGESLLEAETRLRQQRVQLAIAEQKLIALGLTEEMIHKVRNTNEPLSSISVTAPISGVVRHVGVRAGQFVDTEMHLFNIVDRSELLLVGEVLETDAWQIEPGQTIQATFAALPGQIFAGKVEYLHLGIDSDQRTLAVKVRVENRNGLLRPGMSGRMAITVYQTEQAIVCPPAALINTPDRTFVLLRQGEGKYQRREVQLGLRTPEQVEIKKGLFPGDRVIVTGTKLLASMFHTDRKPASPSDSAESPGTPYGKTKASPTIHVAQAVVRLPTNRKAFATPVIAGRIAAIHVQPGELVKADQLLAELESQELRTLQLALLETQEKLRWVTATIKRVSPLASSGSYPKSQLWEHELEQKTLQNKLQNVERKLTMVGLSADAIERLQSTDLSQDDMNVEFVTVPVRAPIAGRVGDFEVALGQVVHTDDSLFEVQDRGTVWIEGYVFEQHASRVEIGQTAEIQFAAYPELRLRGQVIRTAPTLHESARVLPVWIEVENPEQKLREGMLAQVEISPQTSRSPVAQKPSQPK